MIRSTNIVVTPNVEQSTLIHKLAHSIGLVDNGVPMRAFYTRTAARRALQQSDCVMFWQNEGSSDAVRTAPAAHRFDDLIRLGDVNALRG